MAAVASLLPQPNLIYGWWLCCPFLYPRGWRWRLAPSRQHYAARCPLQAGPRALQFFDKLSWWYLTVSPCQFCFGEIISPHFCVIHQQCALCFALHPGNARLWQSAAHPQGCSRNLPFCNLHLDPSVLLAGGFHGLRGMVWITQPTTLQAREKRWQ